MKLTAKQEKFARLVASGLNQSDAYRQAYDAKRMKAETIHEKASRIANSDKVRARLAELRQPAVNAAQLTLQGHLTELARLKKVAEAAGNVSVATRAEELRGRVSGYYIDRKEIRTGPLSNLTDDQLEQFIAAVDSGLPAGSLEAFGKAGAGEKDQGDAAPILPSVH